MIGIVKGYLIRAVGNSGIVKVSNGRYQLTVVIGNSNCKGV